SVREAGEGMLSGMRSVAQTVVSPLRIAGAAITSPITGLSNIFRNLTADEETLSELKEENQRLLARNVELEEAEISLKQLQQLLDMRSSYNLQSTAARVIAGSTDSWSSTVTIDKGTSSGLAVGMPVVDGKGAIGQIISCEATTSTVRLLTDEGSSVSAMIQSSRAQGMLQGSPDGTLHLSFIRTDQTVDVGDIVVTSGLGGVFPKGLPMGKISNVESTPGSTYYAITVEPYSTVSNLEEVLVITSLTEGQQATAEDIASADAGDLAAASGQKVSADEGENTQKERDVESEDSDGLDEDESTSNASSLGGSYGMTSSTISGQADDADESGLQSQVDAGASGTQTSSSSSASNTASETRDSNGFVSLHDTSGRTG
ncbi:MAG: rod shape-determining protein MreC, partial [Atopobiaceae bacterium]|nr:rod shape-determining protein MreC [Atopobiaceae bacterium]